MKKITLLLAFIGMIGLSSCTREEVIVQNGNDNDTIAEVFEVTRSFGPANNFSSLVQFGQPIFASDMVLVYHLFDVVNGADVWRLMPQTYYLDSGAALDYNFDFTRFDVNIFLDSDFPLTTIPPVWTQNQTFRILIIPAFRSGKTSQIDLKDYNEVVKFYGLKGQKPVKL